MERAVDSASAIPGPKIKITGVYDNSYWWEITVNPGNQNNVPIKISDSSLLVSSFNSHVETQGTSINFSKAIFPSLKRNSTCLWPPHVKSTHCKRLWCWEGLGAGGKGDDRGWDGWMASPTRWTWVWVNSLWWTGRPGVLRFMGLQRVRHDWVAELNYLPLNCSKAQRRSI